MSIRFFEVCGSATTNQKVVAYVGLRGIRLHCFYEKFDLIEVLMICSNFESSLLVVVLPYTIWYCIILFSQLCFLSQIFVMQWK